VRGILANNVTRTHVGLETISMDYFVELVMVDEPVRFYAGKKNELMEKML